MLQHTRNSEGAFLPLLRTLALLINADSFTLRTERLLRTFPEGRLKWCLTRPTFIILIRNGWSFLRFRFCHAYLTQKGMLWISPQY